MGRPGDFLNLNKKSHPVTLVLGKMPRDATPETTIAAGPWCFVNQEEFFPDWDQKFHFAPDPLQEETELKNAALAAQGLCIEYIDRLANWLCPHSERLAPVYWQTLLVPWLINVCSQIVERHYRVETLVKKFGSLPLSVPILKDQNFNFQDEDDFTLRGSVGITFNLWLFSRLLEPVWPEAWNKIHLPSHRFEEEKSVSVSAKGNLLNKFVRWFNLSLFFPKLKGMSFIQAFKYSLAMSHPCRQKDHSLDLNIFNSNATGAKINLPVDPLEIFKTAMPASIKKLRHPSFIAPARVSRLRIASVCLYENTNYRQKLAIWRARGGRLGFVQHGGNYGQIAVSCDRQLVEYNQDVFFTWGWKKQGDAIGNFLPLPYPQLQKAANKWEDAGNNNIIFVGTEMTAYGYRLESRPTPLQTLKYRRDKALFFETLGEDLQSFCYYRPYFDLPGTLMDAEWLLPRFPNIRLCSGNLSDLILKCKLLVLDHHGTTMLEAFAANIPMILYWQMDSWPLCPQAGALLAELKNMGIWHNSPENATKKIKEIWPDVKEWWQSPDIQNLRAYYCSKQALTISGNEDDLWISTLKQQ